MTRRVVNAATAALVGVALVGAATPRALAPATGGLWEVSTSATGRNARSVCIAAPAELAQWEHRGARCVQTVLSDQGNRTTIDYQCGSAGFGRSDLTLVTPRTLRIATQGISRSAPFNYVLHARRTGKCARR